MAEAKGHKFGQALGDFCEHAIEPLLQAFANKHGLYLDKKGIRPARKGKLVKWHDQYGNHHDLDYVLERGGSATTIGSPVAFIESAWRRYTKHSRNKAQEIQGAIVPLRDRYQHCAPFMGCILAGIYTSAARIQLQSLGFQVLYFEYPTIISAFSTAGFDAHFDEQTTEKEFANKLQKWSKLSAQNRQKAWAKLAELNSEPINEFLQALERTISRQIVSIRIIPLFGNTLSFNHIEQAIQFFSHYQRDVASEVLHKFEVQIRFSNEDKIDAQFHEQAGVVDFLNHYRTGHWTPSNPDLLGGNS